MKIKIFIRKEDINKFIKGESVSCEPVHEIRESFQNKTKTYYTYELEVGLNSVEFSDNGNVVSVKQ